MGWPRWLVGTDPHPEPAHPSMPKPRPQENKPKEQN